MTPDHATADLAGVTDPDCRDGKHRNCPGGPCQCRCHVRPPASDHAAGLLLRWLDVDAPTPAALPHQVAAGFDELAATLVGELPAGAERTTALRRLLEARDCAARAIWDGVPPTVRGPR